MGKSHKSSSSGHTNCASCIVATIFLIFIAIILLILFFTLFKPKNPQLSVNAIQLPTFTLTNGTTINFTFSQYVTVKNPNRDVFTHYDSYLQLIYSGNQVGFMFIPAGKIESGRTEFMTASFVVDSFPLLMNGGPIIEFQSRMKMGGRVSVLHFFTHHVEASARCSVAISVSDGSVLGFHC